MAVLAGQIISKTNHFALHRCALTIQDSKPTAQKFTPSLPLFVSADVWMGAMVPKKWAKRAVTRNVIKRQIFAIGESFGDRLLPCAHVVRLRCGFDREIYASATSDALLQAIRTEIKSLFGNALISNANVS